MLELSEVVKHPFVQELMQQLDEEPERQDLSLSKKADIENLKVPYTVKNRLVFQEGEHNGLFYSYEDLAENLEQWDNLDLFLAEHADGSNSWIGLIKSPRLSEKERGIRADLEIVNKQAAQTIAYQILNKNGRMGLSPTLDVDKRVENGRDIAGTPWNVISESVVLRPAVQTTVFNSLKKILDGGKMEQELKLKDGEVAVKKEDLDVLKLAKKELDEKKGEELRAQAEQLARLELEIGRISEDEIDSRKDVLAKLSEQERKTLMDTYDWLAKELSDKSEEELFVDSLSEELRGKIPPGLRKFIEEKRKKKKEEEEQKMAHTGDKDKKKYPYPEEEPGKKKKLNTETLSERANLVVKKKDDFMKWNRQVLSDQVRESNLDFRDFLVNNQRRH